MALVSKVYTPGNILQGPADVYIGVTPPTSHNPPTQADEVALDATGQPSSLTGTITAVQNVATPAVTIASTTGFVNGDLVVISGVAGATLANGTWNITVLNGTQFSLNGCPAPGVYTGGGTVVRGIHIGATDGPAQFTVTEKFNEIRADQFESPGDLAFDTVEAEIDFNMKEVDFVKLAGCFMADALSNYASLAASKALQIGGMTSSADVLRSLMLIGPRRDAAGKFLYVFAFKVYLKSAVQLTFHRSAPNVFKLKFGLIADLTRLAGDELAHVVRTK